jgi:CubicO group peptidase (beta-lactamase class C family)
MNAVQFARVHRLFAPVDTPESPGCAVGIYSEGEPLYLHGYGAADLEQGIPIGPATVFHVASLSKQFTAAAVALLERAGCLSLDESLRKYIPELPEVLDVTFRHVIHHTSGLRDQWDLLRLAGWRHADLKTTGDILELAARQQDVNFPAGARFQYINTGYTLAAVAIQRISGQSLREFAAKQIFEPLGMTRTWFHDDHTEIVASRAQAYSRDSAGALKINMPAYETVGPTGLLSTVEDFAHWERNLLAPRVGDAALSRRLATPPAGSNYAFGLIAGEYRGLATLEHAGGDAGYRAHFLRFPSERFAVTIFSNFADMKPETLSRGVADICLEGRFPVGREEAPSVPAWAGRAAGIAPLSPGELVSRTGRYRDTISGMTCRIELRGARLILIGTADEEYDLIPAGPGRFQFTGIEAECLFSENSQQLVVKYAGQVAAVCEPVKEDTTAQSPAPAEDYAGVYWSPELDVAYAIEVSDSALVLRRPKFEAESLIRLWADEFSTSRNGFHLRFLRDGESRVNGLLLTAERAWNLQFVKRDSYRQDHQGTPVR